MYVGHQRFISVCLYLWLYYMLIKLHKPLNLVSDQLSKKCISVYFQQSSHFPYRFWARGYPFVGQTSLNRNIAHISSGLLIVASGEISRIILLLIGTCTLSGSPQRRFKIPLTQLTASQLEKDRQGLIAVQTLSR